MLQIFKFDVSRIDIIPQKMKSVAGFDVKKIAWSPEFKHTIYGVAWLSTVDSFSRFGSSCQEEVAWMVLRFRYIPQYPGSQMTEIALETRFCFCANTIN